MRRNCSFGRFARQPMIGKSKTAKTNKVRARCIIVVPFDCLAYQDGGQHKSAKNTDLL
jgi:hypothetical protein